MSVKSLFRTAVVSVGLAGLVGGALAVYYIADFHKKGYYLSVNRFQMHVLYYYSHYLNTWAKTNRYKEVISPNAIELSTDDLTLVLGDQYDRGAGVVGYIGINKLTHRLEPDSPFVPIYAGMILGGSSARLKRISRLEGEILTKRLNVRYTLTPPHYIDIEILRQGDSPAEPLSAVSYLNRPPDPAIYLVDADGNWRRHYDPVHGRASSVAPDGLVLPPLRRKPNAAYAHGTNNFWDSFTSWRYRPDLALFYGRFRNMVLVYMFPPGSKVIPFMSPSGGGTHLDGVTNPAWDWRFLPAAESGNRCLKMRLIYKPFVNNDDILWEYKRWAGDSLNCRSH